MTIFVRTLDAVDKARALKAVIRNPGTAKGTQRFEVDPETFSVIPRSPFAYWATKEILEIFAKLEPFGSDERAARHGAATLNNGRFLRLAWEAQPNKVNDNWTPYAKGGAYSPFYDDIHLLVRWARGGAELKQYVADVRESNGWGPHWTAVLNGYEYYLRPGLTWPSRTQSGFAPRVLPPGCIFDCKGNAAFIGDDNAEKTLGVLGLLLSTPFRFLVEMQMAFGSYDVGVIQRTPIPRIVPEYVEQLARLTRRAWFLKRSMDAKTETSHAFLLPALLRVRGASLQCRAEAWAEHVRDLEGEVAAIRAAIDARCFELYGMGEADRAAAANETVSTTVRRHGGDEIAEDVDTEIGADDVDDAGDNTDQVRLISALVSWMVGVVFGRFDVRLATGVRSWPRDPEPFDPLPICSPGMLTGDDGLPLSERPAGYPIEVFPTLVHDSGHPLDIAARVRAVFDVVFGDQADSWWAASGLALEVKSRDVGTWLAKGYFGYHLKTHSRSRRKAPLLWPIGTRSGSYVVWLYAHRTSADSLFQVLNDIIDPKLAVEERELAQARQDAAVDPTASQRRAIEARERFVGELREFRENLEALAPLWAPDLNDGVVIVLAPLWRLFSYHRAWSNELKKHWAKLVKGDYDWAQLAMGLWPERVVPKCAEDRSLAIAHGLQDVFWLEDQANEDKWLPREIPVTPIDQLITERHNPAINAALQWVNT
jgi:hypothetical protein